MKKVENQKQVYETFQLLGIKDVTTKRQLKNGTQVWELPYKRCSLNGTTRKIKFASYESGYVRDVSEWNSSCYQINKKYETKEKWWNSHYKKYCTRSHYKRILIPEYEDRMVYLANYILKNHYRNTDRFIIGEWTKECMKSQFEEANKYHNQSDPLPFGDDVQVIVNGHRYNLS